MSPADQFKQLGFFTIPTFLSVGDSDSLIDSFAQTDSYQYVCQSYPHEEKIVLGHDVSAGKRPSSHSAIDRFGVDSACSLGKILHHEILKLVNQELATEYIASPYERSSYYVKRYEPPADQQGWHFDSNCLSAVLYLTDNDDGVTKMVCRNNSIHTVKPERGKLMILDGKNVWHKAFPVAHSPKITFLFNYYTIGHEPRDSQMDSLIFGN